MRKIITTTVAISSLAGVALTLSACSSGQTRAPAAASAPATQSAPAASAPAQPHTFTMGQTYHATGVDFTVTTQRATGTTLGANNSEVKTPYLVVKLHVVNHGSSAIGDSTVAVEPSANGALLTQSNAGDTPNNSSADVLPGASGDLVNGYVMPPAGASVQVKVHPNGGGAQSDAVAGYWTGSVK